ncbi:MAG: DUF4440 domain-containing protein [Actinomycetota bacterium]|nr:DUF4440 domain-containing protein [Actinomycetota bacterium]
MVEKLAPSTVRIENLEDGPKVFEDAFHAGDLDGLVSLFDPKSMFVSASGQVAAGPDAVRKELAGLLATGGRLEIKTKSLHQVEDIALRTTEWSLEGNESDGNPITVGGRAAIVYRRQTDGSWRLLIDNTFLFE